MTPLFNHVILGCKSVQGNFHGVQFLPFHHHPFLSPRTPPSFIEIPPVTSLDMRVSHQPPSPSPASRHVAKQLAPLSAKNPLVTEMRKFEGTVKEFVNEMIYLKRQEDPTPRPTVRHPLPHLSCRLWLVLLSHIELTNEPFTKAKGVSPLPPHFSCQFWLVLLSCRIDKWAIHQDEASFPTPTFPIKSDPLCFYLESTNQGIQT